MIELFGIYGTIIITALTCIVPNILLIAILIEIKKFKK